MRNIQNWVALALGTVVGACGSPAADPGAPSSTASVSAAPTTASTSGATTGGTASTTSSATVDSSDPAKVVNPTGEKPYAGPTATLRGTVRVKGDPPPDMPERIPADCAAAAATHGKLFRVGQDGALADVLVAVTGYPGYVPAEGPSRKMTIEGCAFSARTVGMTFGQYLEVENRDPRNTYIPYLIGGRQAAQLVAMPRREPVKLYAKQPARYPLIDEQGRRFMTADLFVLKFATFDVTRLDGRYEIRGIPVGDVKVSALLPAAKMKVKNEKLKLEPGDNTLDFTLEFDAKTDTPPPPAPPPPSP
ncbi:MAG: hypothetical protein HY908_06100 [Myxococcales bacterium]|nr:hypothetical protein [Myxococcales bacterium]